MLCSAKRRASLRFLSSLRRSQPLSRPYDHGSDMASLSVAYCGCGAERLYSVRSVERFPVFPCRFRGFEFRACFEPDRNRDREPRRRLLHGHGKATRRGGGFDNHKAQFVRDLEVKRIPPLQEVRHDGRSFAPSGCEKAYEHGNLLRHSAHSFPGEKFAVAVDVDEVLGSFVSALNRFIADRYSLNHSVSEYHVYEFFKIWNCSRDEADIRVHEFFKTPYFKSGIHPIPGAQKALHKLSKFCNLSVVTSRQNAIKDHTIEWIEKHYPGLFTEIHFGNHFALNGESRPKSDICRSLGAKVLIDDNPRYAIECADAGMKVLLFDYENSYPWCKTDSIDQHPLVTKVHSWEEVEQQLNTWVLN